MRSPTRRFARTVRASYEPCEDDPWWYDNAGHFACGLVIGALAHAALGWALLPTLLAFLLCATVWEWFEYAYNIRPWDEREEWSIDRAIEDTLLDTYVGATGAYVAVLLL